VKFWVASAIVPLLVAETTTERLQALGQRDPDMLAWWGSAVGCASTLARLERDAALDPKSAELAFQRLRLVADAWHEIEPSEPVRENTVRFFSCACAAGRRCAAARRGLRCCGTPSASLQVVTLDDRLADAMRREGFALVDIAAQ
jgi:hypothetical protein